MRLIEDMYVPNKDVIIKPRPTCIACSTYATWTWTAIDQSVLYEVKMSSAAATSGSRWPSTDEESEDSILLCYKFVV